MNKIFNKTFALIVVSIIFILFMVIFLGGVIASSSSKPEPKPKYKHYELISIKIYTDTKIYNQGWHSESFSEEHIKFSFIDSKGNIISRDREFNDCQRGRYRLHKSKDDKSYLIDKSDYSNASVDFYLSKELYKNIYK